MHTPKLSIVIPVYNAQQYIGGCIDSILNQNFQDFEVILVNDGSKDNSAKICKEYALKDSRISLFNKENGGVSTARNLGLKYAKGEWIYFVDADDSLVEDCLSYLMLISEDIDVVQFGYNKISEGSIEKWLPTESAIYNSADDFSKLSSFNVMTLWIHFIKRSLINLNNINFTEGLNYAEDLEFIIKCYGFASSIQSISLIGYNYYEREGSAMSKAFTFENAQVHLSVAERLLDFFYVNRLSSKVFLKSKVEYMIKSYFSYSVNVNRDVFDKKEFIRVFKLFLERHVSSEILNSIFRNGLFKLLQFSPLFYLFLMRVSKLKSSLVY